MPLGEFITLKRGYDLPSSRRTAGSVPVVSSSGITGHHSTAKVKGPGVVTGRYGTLGEVFYIADDFWPLNTSLYVQDFKGNDPRFSAYFLRTVLGRTSSDKAAVPGVNRNHLHALEIHVTRDVEEQEQIASILSAYDALIENNQRRIRLLETAGRLLYKEWFVHLRFPGNEHVKIKEGLPEGWSRKNLSKLVTTQYGFTETATDEPIGPKFLRGTDINKTSYIDWSTIPYCAEDRLDFRKYELKAGDIVVIRMADPGKVAIVEREIRAVFASYLVRLKQKVGSVIPPLFLFYHLSDDVYQNYVSKGSGGATRKSANAKLLIDFWVLIPPESLTTMFVAKVKPLRDQIQCLLLQNGLTRTAGDLQLSRLMKGPV